MKEILVISLSFSTVFQPYVANDKAVCSGTYLWLICTFSGI